MFLMGVYQKLNRSIPSSAVGLACPNTRSKLFSGEQTSPLRTKRQYYPPFDTRNFVYGKIFNQQV